MNKLFILLILMLTASTAVFSQSKSCQSKKTNKEVHCANIVNTFKSIRVRQLKGTVDSPLTEPIIFQIYKITKNDFEKDPYNLTQGKSPAKSFETGADGEFCIKSLPEGYYVLKFGMSDGGWNCSWINVYVSRKNKDRKIEVGLDIGI